MTKLALTCLFALAISEAPAQDLWSWQNPQPTALDLNATRFVDASTGWAVGAGGTILKTANAGGSWTTQASGSTTINFLGLDFINANTGWIVGTGGNALKTTDGGNTWSTLPTPTSNDLAGVDFLDANNGWAVGYTGTTSGVILNTTDGGNTWNTQTFTGTRFTSVKIVDFYVGYATAYGGKVYKTVDGGNSWYPVASGVTQNLNAAAFVSADVGWAVGASGKIVKTVNGGDNWTQETSGTAQNLTAVYFSSASNGWAVGAAGTLLKTTNGGDTWTAQTQGTGDLTGVAFLSATDGLSVGMAGRVLKTTNGGTGWTVISGGSTQSLNALQFADASNGIAAGTGGTILRTTNGGSLWAAQASGTARNLSSAFLADANNGWAVGDSGTILKTSNGGAVWTAQNSGITQNLTSTFFASATLGWAVGAGGKILKTSDGGATWASKNSGTTQPLTSVFFATPAVGWAGGGSAIVKTVDSGSTWLPTQTGLSNVVALYALDTARAFALRSSGLYRTTNGGGSASGSWTAVSGYTLTGLKSIVFRDASNGYVCTTSGRIHTSVDGGATWNPTQIIPNTTALNALAIAPSSKVVYTAGAGGSILKMTPAAPTGLSYSTNPVVYVVGAPITPNTPSVTGIVGRYSVAPALPAGMALDTITGILSGTPSVGQAAASYTISAANASGAATAVVSITIYNPITSFAYPAHTLTLAKGTVMTPQVPTVGGTPPLGPITFSVAPNLPAGLTLDAGTGTISGAPLNAQAGANYVVTAKNGVTQFNKNDTLRILVLTPPSNLSYAVNPAVYTINTLIAENTATISVVTGSPVQYTVSPALPTGLSLNAATGTVSGTPTTAAAARDYLVTGTNSSGSTSVVLRITVLGPPSALTYPAVVFGVNLAGTSAAPSISGSVTKFTITPTLPTGLALDTLTGIISGTPTAALASANFTVTATTTGFGSTTATLTLSVLNPIVLFFYSAQSLDLAPGVAMTSDAAIVAGATPFNPVGFSVSPPLPTGLVLDASTGTVFGTPTYSKLAADYIITASNGIAPFAKSDTLHISVSGTSYAPGDTPPVAIRTPAAGVASFQVRVGGSALSLPLPEGARSVRVRLADAQGRTAADKTVAVRPGSAAEFSWNGSGRASSAGVYFMSVRFMNADGKVVGAFQKRTALIP